VETDSVGREDAPPQGFVNRGVVAARGVR
jgi:hypothetical protein